MDMAHPLEPLPDCPDAEGIFLRKLPQCQLAVYVVGYYGLTVSSLSSYKLPSAIKALV